jgi:nitrogenase subunit NifH
VRHQGDQDTGQAQLELEGDPAFNGGVLPLEARRAIKNVISTSKTLKAAFNWVSIGVLNVKSREEIGGMIRRTRKMKDEREVLKNAPKSVPR